MLTKMVSQFIISPEMPASSKKAVSVWVFALFLLLVANGQTGSGEEEIPQEANIELGASVEREQFPQDETSTLTITLKWLGSQDAFEVDPLSPPRVDNLRIVSSSSSVETRMEAGEQITLRQYKFVLKGESEGVGTIGRVQANYRQTQTGESSFLETQPIQLEVTPPVARREFKFGLFFLIIITAGALGILGLTVYRLIVSKRERLPASAVEALAPTLEERLLQQVREVESGLENLTSEEFHSRARSIALDFLQEKYELAARSSTTADLVAEIEQKELPQKSQESLKKTLLACDEARFGSRESSQQEKKEVLSLLREVLEPEG
ncbi:MAG: hypothetical protein AMJ41_03030 [candidate division Zixibacteria bacterium DG_27]|nr:MAG: hypothetical protein AMJ41_03030 [candidate division Zixibacteria bacterium DG_27]